MAVKFQDYYQTLGVDRRAPQPEIQKAFRKLAQKYHPDVNKNKDAEERFKTINEAYEVLGDPEKRRRYDTLGNNWHAGQEFQPPPGWEELFASFGRGRPGGRQQQATRGFGGFSDFFEMLFGGEGGAGFEGMGGAGAMFGGSGARQQRGTSHTVELPLTLEEIFRGGTKSIQLEILEPVPNGPPKRSLKTYQVKIPHGVVDGAKIRLAGQGSPGASGAPSGDLLLKVKILPHARFKRNGPDITAPLFLSPPEAALGTRVNVPTLDGQIALNVPAGTQSGQHMRLREKGLPKGTAGRGDLLLEVRIMVPKNPTDRERELYEELAKVSSFAPRS